MSGDFGSPDLNGNGSSNGNGFANGSSPGSPETIGNTAPTSSAVAEHTTPKAVDDVMYSDIGLNTLLNRLKQSIASARDFAAFLKQRSRLEEEQATGLKKLAKAQSDTIKRTEARGGSYATHMAEVLRVHERIAENGMQFALSLHQMHEDLNELSANMERGRKQWKHDGLAAEKNAQDAEAAMHKAKSRYDSLAEDYDRARTGDTKGGRRLGLKGPKSAEQHESDLQRKLQTADADYEEKVRMAKSQRESLIRETRPKTVRALQELCRECDSGLTLQLQKFTTFNEKLLLGNGLAVSPLTGENNSQRSLRDVILEIDNEKDFHGFISSHANKVPPRPSEIKYEQHPTLMPKTQQPSSRSASASVPSSTQPQQGPVQQPSLSVNTGSASQPSSMNSRYSSQPAAPGPLVAPSQAQNYNQPTTSFAQQPPPSQPNFGQSPTMYGGASQTQSPYAPPPQSRDTYNPPPYPTHPSERSAYSPQQAMTTSPPPGPPPSQQRMAPATTMSPVHHQPPPPQNQSSLPPLRPVFGVSLQDLFARDLHSAVPLVVIQCILAIDHFGLDVEGIYRLSGTSSHVTALKNAFNHDPSSVDFRNPANFYHDVNSVATLLKQFFKDLPDPLIPRAAYGMFIDGGRLEDEGMRRDALHQAINDLPDPNYATLRALVLHLGRVMANEGRNRMGSSNLALCFAPSLMGTHTGGQIADASLQARVVDTILVNATAIFDED